MREKTTRLPDGRQVSLGPEAVARLSCGILVLDPVLVFDNPDVARATAEVSEQLRLKHDGLLPSQIEGLAEARNLYKSFNMDPSRYRPSSEALLRRVMKNKDLYQISNAVDSCNLACLKFLLPVGMYDLNLVKGDVVLRAGNEGESYAGIRKGDVNLNGRLGLFDEDGPFGSPTSDSARTCVSPGTSSILAVIMATNSFAPEKMSAAIDVFANLFTEHCKAVETFRAMLGDSS